MNCHPYNLRDLNCNNNNLSNVYNYIKSLPLDKLIDYNFK